MTNDTFPEEGLARKPQVLQFLNISNTALYSNIKRGKIPKPIKIGKVSGWDAQKIREILNRGVSDA